jgi:hypothetical protein
MLKIIHDGEIYVPIKTFAEIVNRSVPAVRHLCTHGGIRRLRTFRDGTHLYILFKEAYEYPFVKAGAYNEAIYHYRPWRPIKQGNIEREPDENLLPWERYLCRACSYGESPESCTEAAKSLPKGFEDE